jgi:GntR family transcriptional repressor for pyruvate dehydrogenase complex
VPISDSAIEQAARSGKGRASAVDGVVRHVLDLIRNRGLNVGDALPTERELCELFDASRNTVREALRTIRAYGLIDARPRIGAVLADRHGTAIHDFFAAQMGLSRSSFRDVQGFRRIIEVGVGDSIIQHASNADIDAVGAINDRIEESRSAEEAARHDFDFHIGLMKLAGNRTLVDIYEFLAPVTLRIMTVGKTIRPVLSDTRQTHAEIIAALKARDRIAYAYLMSRHLDFGLQFLPEEDMDPKASSPSTTDINRE